MKPTNPAILIDAVTERVTLHLFRSGCDKINFDIVSSLPANVKDLQKRFDLTKMPINRRLNDLAEVGLLRREKYEGGVYPTELTNTFIKTIKDLKTEIIKELPRIIQ